MSYGQGNLLNFLKATAAKARSSAANTHRKGSSQFNQIHYDNYTNEPLADFRSKSPPKYQESPVKQLKLFESTYDIDTNQPLNLTPTKLFADKNTFDNTSFFNQKTNTPPQYSTHYNTQYNTQNNTQFNTQQNAQFNTQFNNQFNSGNNKSMQNANYFNNPEINGKKTYSFIKEQSQQPPNFSSARQETAQLLQTISQSLRKQITNLDSRIHKFYRAMDSTLQEFFKNIKQQIYSMVQQAIIVGRRQSQQFQKMREQKLVGQLYRAKDTLQKEYARIELMKSDMNTSQWRKTAGEIIANDVEQRVYDSMKRSTTIEAKRWEPPNLNPYLKDIQMKLIDCLSLR